MHFFFVSIQLFDHFVDTSHQLGADAVVRTKKKRDETSKDDGAVAIYFRLEQKQLIASTEEIWLAHCPLLFDLYRSMDPNGIQYPAIHLP